MTDRQEPRFRRRFRGYDIKTVDAAMELADAKNEDLSLRVDELLADSKELQTEVAETKHDLARSRAELRYWNDRASYVDSEVARARQRAIEIEHAARERAETIEADAQERSIRMVDRVCTEANALLQSAREEARDMFMRFETDVDMSQQKLDQLETARRTIADAIQQAMGQFSKAASRMEELVPAKVLMETTEQPRRRALPTFGRQKALEASARFDGDKGTAAQQAISEPLKAKVEDALSVPSDMVIEQDLSTTPIMPTVRKVHKPDTEFAEL